MRPVLGRPALLQKILLAMIADWTVLDQSFFLCKRNFPKLVVCAGKVQNADVLIPVSYTHLDVYKRQPLSPVCFL